MHIPLFAAAAVLAFPPAVLYAPNPTPVTKAEASPVAANPTITVSTYNVCKKECGTGRWAWKKRVPKLAKTIASSRSDIVGVQEAYGMTNLLSKHLTKYGYEQAGTSAGTQGCGAGCVQESHIFYNTRTVTPTPLTIPNPQKPEPCLKYPDGNGGVLPEPVSPGLPPTKPVPPTPPDTKNPDYRTLYEQYLTDSRLYEQNLAQYETQYAQWQDAKTDYLQRKETWKTDKREWATTYRVNKCSLYDPWPATRDGSVGYPSLKTLTGENLWKGTRTERLAGWAILTYTPTNTQILTATAHLPPEKLRATETTRKRAAEGLTRHVADIREQFGAPNLPTFLAVDLNSFHERQPRGAQYLVEQAGYLDGWEARKHTNGAYNTVNYSGVQRNPFPAKPIKSYNNTPARIDYVFNNHTFTPKTYEVALKLRGGYFDNAWRASDHNLVRTVWAIPSEYQFVTGERVTEGETAGTRIDTSMLHPTVKAWLAKPWIQLTPT